MTIVLILAVLSFDQAQVDQALVRLREAGEMQQPASVAQAGRVSGSLPRVRTPERLPDDLVIGDVPGETLFVTGYFYRVGNIVVVGDGVVRLVGADFNLDGDITMWQAGRFEAESSDIRFVQHYIYDHIIALYDSSALDYRDCNTRFEGYPFNLGAMSGSTVSMVRVRNRDFTTAVVSDSAQVSMDNVKLTGEWLFDRSGQARFEHVDSLLTWYFFPDSAQVDFTFPSGDSVDGFVLDSTVPGVSGVRFHVEIDSSTNVMWAAIPLAGSDVVLDSSELRVVGIMLAGADSFTVTGLVNGLEYDDYTLPVRDRRFRVRNTMVHTWNAYAIDSCPVRLERSIFGEFCVYGKNHAEVWNAFCDGSGGHLETAGESFMLVAFSSASCDVITKGRGVSVMGWCSMPLGNLWATSASVLVLVNCQFVDDPIPSDTAVVMVTAISGPGTAAADDSVGIMGSAWLETGPYNPLEFGRYRLWYRENGDSTWLAIGGDYLEPVRRDTLGYWDTHGLGEGVYDLRLVMYSSTNDSIEAVKGIRLTPAAVGETPERVEPALGVRRLGRSKFRFTGLGSGERLGIFDPSGRRVASLIGPDPVWKAPAAGVYCVCYASGALVCRLAALR